MSHYTEKAVTLGRHDHLAGIVTTPAEFNGDVPMVVLLTAGLVSSAGPFRMYVSLARSLALAGVATFRLDLSGVGESTIPRTDADMATRTRQDIEDALNYLQQHYRASQFIVGGLCSGADNAHTAACSDQRIAGAILLDGYAYKNTAQRIRGLVVKALNPVKVARWLVRQLSGSKSKKDSQAEAAEAAEAGYARSFPPADDFASELISNVEAGKRYLCIYSGGVSGYYDEPNQLLRGLRLERYGAEIREVYFPECDHTYALSGDRNKMVDCVTGWVSEHWSTKTSTGS